MRDPHQQIADLEADIERLSEAAERCRKIIVSSKAAVASGGLLLLALITGLFRFDPTAFLVGIPAVLAGIALTGTNRSTLDEITAAIREREAQRRAAINGLELRVVEAS